MDTPRLYIAAPFECQASALGLRQVLRGNGFVITSRWLDEPPIAMPDMTPDFCAVVARRDIVDIYNADAMVLVNPEEWRRAGTGGRHVEAGIALTRAMPFFILGVRSNVFHHLSSVDCAATEVELLEQLHHHFARRLPLARR